VKSSLKHTRYDSDQAAGEAPTTWTSVCWCILCMACLQALLKYHDPGLTRNSVKKQWAWSTAAETISGLGAQRANTNYGDASINYQLHQAAEQKDLKRLNDVFSAYYSLIR